MTACETHPPRLDALLQQRAVIARQVRELELAIAKLDGRRPVRAGFWTRSEVRFAQGFLGLLSHAELAKGLGRPVESVKTATQRFGLVTRRQWTAEEREFVRAHARDMTAAQTAAAIGKSISGVYQMRDRLGLTVARAPLGEGFVAFIQEKHALGWSDAEIAAAWGNRVERHTVGVYRKKLGLPHNALSEHRRQLVREKTREQLEQMGLTAGGLASLRYEAHRKFARDSGWPEDLLLRETQILNAMWDRGPMTRREIAEAIGLRWRGVHNTLAGNRPSQTSYLGELIRRGLVVNLGRIVRTGRRGGNVCIYSLSFDIQRRKTA